MNPISEEDLDSLYVIYIEWFAVCRVDAGMNPNGSIEKKTTIEEKVAIALGVHHALLKRDDPNSRAAFAKNIETMCERRSSIAIANDEALSAIDVAVRPHLKPGEAIITGIKRILADNERMVHLIGV